jgi:branched-chain amino acid transport system permease protein
LPAAALLCFVFGFLFGLVAARLAFLYLALATYGLAVITPPVLKSRYLEDITLGVQGMYFTRPGPPAGLDMHIDRWWYLVALAVALFGSWLAWNMLRGRPGRALRALRDHEIAALGMGIPVARYKALAFAVSAAFAGVGGAIGGLAADYVAPDNFRFAFSLQFVAGLVIGGMRLVAGAWIGGIALLVLPALAGRIDADLIGAIYGALLIGIILIAPYGLAGGYAALRERLRARRG